MSNARVSSAKMAENDIDLYAEDIDQDFAQDNFGGDNVDLYDDVIAAPPASNADGDDTNHQTNSAGADDQPGNFTGAQVTVVNTPNSSGRRHQLYVGNLTWVMEDLLKGKKSIVWNFFTPESEIKAVCHYCKQTLSYKSSISNLKQHILKKHPFVKLKSIDNKTTSNASKDDTPVAVTEHSYSEQTTSTQLLPSCSHTDIEPSSIQDSPATASMVTISRAVDVAGSSNTKAKSEQTTLVVPKTIRFSPKKSLDDKLLNLIVKDLQPFSIVEDKGFREFTYSLNPSYSLPSRKMLTNTLLPIKYEEVKLKVQKLLTEIPSVTLTTDCWTSCNNESYLALTAHFINSEFSVQSVLLEVSSSSLSHTSTNLAVELERITQEWCLEDKILIAVSDNAANIRKAITEELHWTHLGCIAHTINLIVKYSLVHIEELITKVSSLVSFFNTDLTAKVNLEHHLKQNGKSSKKLKQPVPTQWNSVYYMLERVFELKEEVQHVLGALEREDLSLTDEEFDNIAEFIQILAPMESTTRLMSSEKQVTLSVVLIVTNGLNEVYKNLKQSNQFSASGKKVLDKLYLGIVKRFRNLENNTTLLVSTFLDPRFKNIGFASASSPERARTSVTNNLVTLIEEKYKESTIPTPAKNQKVDKNSIWATFDQKVSQFAPNMNTLSRAIIEVQRYLEEPLLARTENPLNWWKMNSYNYPYLSELFKRKFGTVATSVPCERLFSKTGELLSSRRNRLSGDMVQKIMFLHQNM